MKKKITRGSRFEMRKGSEFDDAIALLKKQYPRKTAADIIHSALARYLRVAIHNFDKETQKLADRLEYNCDTDT